MTFYKTDIGQWFQPAHDPTNEGGEVIVDTDLVLNPFGIVRNAVPQAVNGQAILNRAMSAAYSATEDFVAAVRDMGPGSLRYPAFGNTSIPIIHWDNKHTLFFPDFSTVVAGDIWDPNYNSANAAPRTELLTVEAFTSLVVAAGLGPPFMIFNWTSCRQWRVIGGTNHYFRDPVPLDINGVPIDPPTAAAMSSDQLQFIENRRMLKAYFDGGGPPNPICQMGGEDNYLNWLGGDGVPWTEPDSNNANQTAYVAANVGAFIDNLQGFADFSSYSIKHSFTFTEAPSSGYVLPLGPDTITHHTDNFRTLVTSLGPKVDYASCTLHYRGTWARWLTEDHLQFAFFTQNGQGSLANCKARIESLCASAGYPDIKFLPIENSVGNVADGELEPALWQRALMASQYVMEVIQSGIEQAYAFNGFIGNYEDMGLSTDPSVTASIDGIFTRQPEWYVLKMFGDILRNSPNAIAVVGGVPRVLTLALAWGNSIGLFLLNKDAATSLTVKAGDFFISPVKTKRFSESETQAPDVADAVTLEKNVWRLALKAYSLTYVEFEGQYTQ